ncbi:MAG: TolC family protein [Gammaproteobacteria bacterium]|nr:MAG: TolC family protein [Gammaproteobacteria bacterium]
MDDACPVRRAFFSFMALFWLHVPAKAQPLTLAKALALAEAPAPELALAASARALAGADRLEAESRMRPRLALSGRAAVGEPLSGEYSRNDAALTVIARRRLTDFGRTQAEGEAAKAAMGAADARYRWARWQRRLKVIDAYLEVVMADHAFRVADERMAVRFVRLDEMRDRHALGQVSDLELLEQETRYQEARTARMEADAKRRTARARLAEELGMPGQLPRDVAPPPGIDPEGWKLPPLEVLEREVLEVHPRLRALAGLVEAAQARVAAARASERPDLSFEAGVGAFSRPLGSRNRWSAGVVIEVPLFTGGRRDAAVARARGGLLAARAELEAARRQVRLELRELWEDIGILKARAEEARTRLEYRDLYLERSRALYELEVTVDLGDAMIELNEAMRRQEEVKHALLRDRARLDAMLDRPPLGEVVR